VPSGESARDSRENGEILSSAPLFISDYTLESKDFLPVFFFSFLSNSQFFYLLTLLVVFGKGELGAK